MSVAEARYRIQNLKRRYVLLRSTRDYSVCIRWIFVSLCIGWTFYRTSLVWKLSLSLLAGLIVIIQQAWHYKLFSLSHTVFIQYLNRHYPQLEESADLFIQVEAGLNPLQQLQLEKTLNNFNFLYPQIRCQIHWFDHL
jgi:hypothetical protein